MSSINGMMDALESLPARGTEAEMRRAARNLAVTGRRVGASDRQTRELLDMCGLMDEPDTTKPAPIKLIGPRRPPTWRRQCGTPAGYAAHRNSGEGYCDECRAANARYRARQRVRVHVQSRRKG